MPQFTWTSRDAHDVVRSGVVTAPSAQRAAAALAARSLKVDALLALPEAQPNGTAASDARTPALDLASIRPAELLQSVRDMVSLLRKGVDRQRVFTAVGAASRNPVLAEVLQTMAQRTSSGEPLYRAMAAWPALFDSVVQHLVRHGEGENRLPEGLKAVHAYLEFKQAMQLLHNQLQGKPPALTQAAHQEIARSRVLACLAAGQAAGLPLDTNVHLATQHSGDNALSARLLESWQNPPAGSPPSSPAERLPQALIDAGIVSAPAWRQAFSSAPSAELHAALQVLTQSGSASASAAVDRVGQRLQWGLKTGLRVAAVLAVTLLGYMLMR